MREPRVGNILGMETWRIREGKIAAKIVIENETEGGREAFKVLSALGREAESLPP